MRTPVPYCQVPPDWAIDFSQCLHEWQALISSILAIIVGGFTIYYLRQQIKESSKSQKELTRRKDDRNRSLMPIFLSETCEIINELNRTLISAKTHLTPGMGTIKCKISKKPEIDYDFIVTFLENSENESVNKILIEAIRKIQILWARVRILNDPSQQRNRLLLGQEVRDFIILTAQVSSLFSSLFDFARGISETAPAEVSWGRVDDFCNSENVTFIDVLQEIAAQKKISENFWTAE